MLRGSAMLEVGDPEYFVAISFPKGHEVTLDGAPSGCAAAFQPPHELDAQTIAVLSAVPIDQHDLPPNLVQAASLLMNVITLKCPGGDQSAPDAATAVAMEAAGGGMPPAGTASSDTLNASDKAIGAGAPAASSPPPAPVPAEPPKEVHVIDINEPPPKPAEPAPKPGFLGWLGGLWQGMFK
jgi:hypothetical protein